MGAEDWIEDINDEVVSDKTLYCENYGHVIIRGRGSWVHLNAGKDICKPGVIVYAKPKIDKRCGNCYMYQKTKRICLYFNLPKKENDKCMIWELDVKMYLANFDPTFIL